ncbi:HPP family protein [Paraglaciecola aquimarina]|uniref:HPP family protein n=1 Tax=Paraglaciecola aquimarina TaxID=1235557 RepID=A0ABU3T2H4_9ALTE|nr:HPP family protein [Paraglaciecola aquimarina]MDU0356408.1 HPP family protein [Paraglaciecola aquimarina]
MKPFIHELRSLVGYTSNSTSHAEKLISALGGSLSIGCIFWLAQILVEGDILDSTSGVLVVASMGASAVLLFAVPHGALSQPWAVTGGHILSGLVGISCFKLFGDSFIVAGLAVGLAIGAMYYLHCIHPLGGATALTVVIGGPTITDMGYQYILLPVIINIVIILLFSVIYNGLFKWCRYPAHLTHRLKKSALTKPINRQYELTHEDFAAAMQELDSYVDITPEGLADLLELAKQHAEKNITHPAEILAGRIYSNGKMGNLWSIRQIVDAAPTDSQPHRDQVIYKVLSGDGAYKIDICLRSEFHQWARFEVIKHQQQWVKVTTDSSL